VSEYDLASPFSMYVVSYSYLTAPDTANHVLSKEGLFVNELSAGVRAVGAASLSLYTKSFDRPISPLVREPYWEFVS